MLFAARRLAHSGAQGVLIDRRNFHTFTPLLYQVAAAELEPDEIAYPVRTIFRGQKNVRMVLGEVQRVDVLARTLQVGQLVLDFEDLILATGSTTSFFGVQGAPEHTLPLKTPGDAVRLRSHILGCFERAANTRLRGRPRAGGRHRRVDRRRARRPSAPLPMLAPVAIQAGEAAAENILRTAAGRPARSFRYRDKGTMATIGRNAAVAILGGRGFSGFVAWVLWLAIHISSLIGLRNRLLVLTNWAWDYLFFERGVRLIDPNP